MFNDRNRSAPPSDTFCADGEWQTFLAHDHANGAGNDGSPLAVLYGPYLAARRHGGYAVGHLAQSLDGRIATAGGVSQWLSGAADLVHTHRMRALADAVIVGVNTVLHDDPQLTVRRCAGSNPVRVVIDPVRRLDGSQRVFADAQAPTLLLVAEDCANTGDHCGRAEIVALPRTAQGIDPRAIRAALAARGLHCLLIEGGGITVSRFVAAGVLDRLQLTIAPVLLGSGRPGVQLPEITDLNDSLRPPTRRFALGDDVLIECVFRE